MSVDKILIEDLLSEDEERQIYRVKRSMFTDEDIFNFEMENIFEAGWVYLAHESQLPAPGDFVTSKIGRQPVIVNRNEQGKIGGILNACAHRGAKLALTAAGNKRRFVCPFHSWSYDADGKLQSCGDVEKAGYSDSFDKAKLNLTPIAKVESYRGFIFGSLSGEVPELSDHLGEAKKFIDLIIDQDPNGEIEVIPGVQKYTFDGNWKLQCENGVDGYHIGSIHGNYVMTVNNRTKLGSESAVKPMDVSGFSKLSGGYYAFENGHVVLWNQTPNPDARPTWASREKREARVGGVRSWWMHNCWRNLCLYPNVFLMDQMSTQIRIIQPISVNKTEIQTLCFAPKNESREARALRIRQYEDFFNAAGMATPDDLAAFNYSQEGFMAMRAEWSDISRGAKNLLTVPDERTLQLDLKPQFYGTGLEDEGIYLNQHRRWKDMLLQALND